MHLYLYPRDDRFEPEEIQSLSERISSNRLEKAGKYLNEEDRIRCIIGGNLIRYAIFKFSRIPYSSMVFGENSFGKPEMVETAAVHFNLSYSDEWIGCAVGREPLGFDIERIKKIDLSIGEKYFTSDESRYIMAAGGHIRWRRFFEIWVLKESYVKAIGVGLSCPLDAFSITLGDHRIDLKSLVPHLPQMDFFLTSLGGNHLYALCYPTGLDQPETFIISSSDLFKGGVS